MSDIFIYILKPILMKMTSIIEKEEIVKAQNNRWGSRRVDLPWMVFTFVTKNTDFYAEP